MIDCHHHAPDDYTSSAIRRSYLPLSSIWYPVSIYGYTGALKKLVHLMHFMHTPSHYSTESTAFSLCTGFIVFSLLVWLNSLPVLFLSLSVLSVLFGQSALFKSLSVLSIRVYG